METYRQILVALDLSEHSEAVCQRAKELAGRYGASLTLLHVIEYVPVEPMGEALLPSVELSDDLRTSAETRLAGLAQQHDMADVPQLVRVGNIKAELVQVAEDLDADLIVLGSRERHGVAILVNYTEDTVLHAAPCDVLAVRVR
ncbi:MAG: universal stress protein [Gammaproteobacteria bacterium]|nr:universal stress protein [Gammaproteobacteria bacterium]NNF60752.1 universal stress protein [Gammaproteobacteria bacterium]NNM20237.1 universal stress protein [Gammaproteobacteria bacterium]